MAAIFVKVFVLAIKTIAKPVASRFEHYVMSRPESRQRAINAAQYAHAIEIWITRGAEGRTGKAFIGDMSEEKSIAYASKLVSEGFVFAVGAALVLLEYQRGARNDAAKKIKEKTKREQLQLETEREQQRLQEENEQQTRLIQRLLERVDNLEKSTGSLAEKAEQYARSAHKSNRGWFQKQKAASLSHAT
mmetsp:Transcript_5498/g.9523  ORF Transcript_5498/g.9523 Transcript_5498/m.9523 type:complete len:190 (+) Transcript_5498:243-812(+)|eukprot:CAMPEP_0119105024 /NCGR_PEP_ID=MMETSP1180-20130426/3087_1 /TAXON_ID=3052 ORGANISM="Chlamydomonas cf sp, Strain CCMP681" /NCGR_SAMPLE_ID=MMETSP1180 /ASSEMBLY_ACC=CAM_ASM_000741 /LENGTH=189 /DNA_ID=CAMNT_0007089949 /DNA_START=239 /DNA_END=808 /DNA_ORIENTATION=-